MEIGEGLVEGARVRKWEREREREERNELREWEKKETQCQ